MLYQLGVTLQEYYGPFRLLTSRLFLGGMGMILSWLAAFYLLPRLSGKLPRDRGRAFAVQSQVAQGKPTGAGVIFITVYCLVQLLVLPFTWQGSGIIMLTFAAMLTGWFDDKSTNSWSEYKKAVLDLILAVAASLLLCEASDANLWLPFTKTTFEINPFLYTSMGTVLIWATINSTNCPDGVDGLSGTLASIALISLGALLYFILGHQPIANYLLLPHYPDGSIWGIMAFGMVGVLAGYLWYNAHPSVMLMGDAGSRAIGFLLGVLVLKSGNPLIIFIVSGVLLINGGTGLVKVALLRFFKIAIFKSVRFPLHDHVRHNKGWSNPQVLMRFALLQCMLTIILIVFLVKVR